MEENHKRIFTTIWAILLLCSVVLGHITHYSDSAWAQSESVNILNRVLFWVTTVITIILFAWHNISYWRQGKRLFWRKWRRWTGGLLIGIAILAIMLFAINLFRSNDICLTLSERNILFAIFALGGLIWLIARYKQRN